MDDYKHTLDQHPSLANWARPCLAFFLLLNPKPVHGDTFSSKVHPLIFVSVHTHELYLILMNFLLKLLIFLGNLMFAENRPSSSSLSHSPSNCIALPIDEILFAYIIDDNLIQVLFLYLYNI